MLWRLSERLKKIIYSLHCITQSICCITSHLTEQISQCKIEIPSFFQFIGKLMDIVAEMSPSGEPNYLVPFASNLLFLVFTITSLCFISMDLQLPKGSTNFGEIVILFKSVDILVFLLLMLVFGTFYGFMENFLFIYLKDDLGAPMSLLGFTITVGALFSIPFIFFADPIVDFLGRDNTFLLALAMYCVRYVGYSFITSPYLAFPFETLELFTNNLMRIASIQWASSNA